MTREKSMGGGKETYISIKNFKKNHPPSKVLNMVKVNIQEKFYGKFTIFNSNEIRTITFLYFSINNIIWFPLLPEWRKIQLQSF